MLGVEVVDRGIRSRWGLNVSYFCFRGRLYVLLVGSNAYV